MLESDDQATSGAWWLLVVVALTFCALFAATALLPVNPYLRVQQLRETIHFRAIWGYQRVVFDNTPIDIAIIGNSRLGAGVSAPDLEEVLGRRLGRQVNVVNLSLAQDGANSHYAIAKRLVEYHPEVKLIVLVAIEQYPRMGHPAFRNLADIDDIIGAPIFINTDYLDDISYIPYRQMSVFVQSHFSEMFGVEPTFDPGTYAGPEMDTTTSFRQFDGTFLDRDTIPPAVEVEKTANAVLRGLTPPVLPQWAAEYEFAVPRAYMRKIAHLADDTGAGIAFLYLPIYGSDGVIRNRRFYEQFGPVIDAGFLAGDPTNYADGSHLNHSKGVPLLTSWLADQLAELPELAAPARSHGAYPQN